MWQREGKKTDYNRQKGGRERGDTTVLLSLLMQGVLHGENETNRHFFVQDTLTLLVHSITLFLPIHMEHRDQAHTQFPSFLLENLSTLWLLIWTTYFFSFVLPLLDVHTIFSI